MIRTLAILGQPILPATSRTLLAALAGPGAAWSDAGGEALPVGAFALPALPVLFPKIADEVIAAKSAQLQALATSLDATAAKPEAPKVAATPLAPIVEFETFAATDLRVGTVRKAERHPKADRLLVLQVDLGFESRTVVAGVAESYAPEELVGRKVIVVANLAPRALRGIESRGMLLAADGPDGKPRFLAPDPATPDGTKIK